MQEEVLEERSREREVWDYSADGLLGFPAGEEEVDRLFEEYRESEVRVDEKDVAGLEYYDAVLDGDSVRAIVGDSATVYLNSEDPSEEILEPFYEVLGVEEEEVYDLM
ncbi:MAG: hypothetical protein ABEK01_03865 [Candidatus Nanohaloarchaea archaeon]